MTVSIRYYAEQPPIDEVCEDFKHVYKTTHNMKRPFIPSGPLCYRHTDAGEIMHCTNLISVDDKHFCSLSFVKDKADSEISNFIKICSEPKVYLTQIN
jgi:hypothetical protein